MPEYTVEFRQYNQRDLTSKPIEEFANEIEREGNLAWIHVEEPGGDLMIEFAPRVTDNGEIVQGIWRFCRHSDDLIEESWCNGEIEMAYLYKRSEFRLPERCVIIRPEDYVS